MILLEIKKKSKRALKEELGLTTGQILSENIVFESILKIKSLYIEKHYHNVIIDTMITSGEIEYSQNLTFIINEGKKHRVKNKL